MSATPQERAARADAQLVRGIGRWDLVAVVVNLVIGAGILGLPAKTFAAIGVYSIGAWVLCALIMGLVALCFAEVGGRFTQTGGAYLYAHTAFGAPVGFFVGWLAWISRIFSFATIGNLAITYAGGIAPRLLEAVPRFVCITLFVTGLALVVLTGVRRSTRVNNVLTACKLAVLFGFVIAGLPFVEPSRFVMPHAAPAISEWQAALLVMTFAFVGSESALVAGGEMRDPRRDVPFALGIGLGVVALLYIGIQVVCIGNLPELASSQRPVVDAAGFMFGPIGALVINVGALVTMAGTLFAVLLTASRQPFAIAEQGQLPQALARVHPRFRTPYVAVLLTALLAWILTVYSSFMGALTVTALTRLVGYVTTCAALVVLRRRDAGVAQPGFRVPAGPLVSMAALAACCWLMLGSSRTELLNVLALAIAGLLISGGYVLGARRRSRQGAAPPRE